MGGDDLVELDAWFAVALELGPPEPKDAKDVLDNAEWVREHELYQARWDELNRQAAEGEMVPVDPWQVAQAVAHFAEINTPERIESVEVLVELVLRIQRSGIVDRRVLYLTQGIRELGWAGGPDKHFDTHIAAATDLGLFDPPGQPRRKSADTDEHSEPQPKASPARIMRRLETKPVYPAAGAYPQGEQPEPSLRDRFLWAWEAKLGEIAEVLLRLFFVEVPAD